MKVEVAVSYSSFLIAFAYFIMFNLFDLSSTFLALRLGLSEANLALLDLSSRLGVGLVNSFILVKSVFFVVVGGLVILGLATRNQGIRKTILLTVIIFSFVFALVSVNNFLTIYSILSA
ncbi:MAG TPA: hypothetical protein VN739_07650 [Nitrososphaerales archaeon]|nr:hypothetical protein [Nitrososphaerales archaeon]